MLADQYLKINLISKEVFSSGSNRETVISLQAQKPGRGCYILHRCRCLSRSWTKETFQFLWHAQRCENNYFLSELLLGNIIHYLCDVLLQLYNMMSSNSIKQLSPCRCVWPLITPLH